MHPTVNEDRIISPFSREGYSKNHKYIIKSCFCTVIRIIFAKYGFIDCEFIRLDQSKNLCQNLELPPQSIAKTLMMTH